MLNRILGVLKLDVNTFEEIEADESATSQAAIVVAIVAVVGGIIGGILNSVLGTGSFVSALLSQIVTAFVSWIIWSGVTYFVGTTFFGGKATFGEMLRVLGFAQAPGILAIIPVCGTIVAFLWTIATGFIAVRQGLDVDNTKAAITVVIAFVVVFVASILIGTIFGAGAAAVGALSGG